jgi:hypothetical protein
VRIPRLLALAGGVVAVAAAVFAADTVPTDVQFPGTQPGELATLERVGKCDNCHFGYDPGVEPVTAWRGGAMSQAGRDPLFWATLAVAEQDFDGVGDLCLRCHSPDGWISGRSTPTDGSGLDATDDEGVACDLCHRMTRPDGSEWTGVQNAPFLAHDEGATPVGYYGSGMYVLYDGAEKLGPFDDATPPHGKLTSTFHRSSDLCGSCHDVSNPVTGDLAHNQGSATGLPPGGSSGVPGAPVDDKAAFNAFPFQYGVVERTFSEHVASGFYSLPVSSYATLPAELKGGAIRAAYERALVAGEGGDYDDGTTRTFSCQSCHMPPVTGQGCNKNPPVRPDLPLHDQTGGNDWLGDAIVWLDNRNQLRLGGGVTADERSALAWGKRRARWQLANAAALEVVGDTLRVVNRTGHRLPTGYPEGRRMWVNVRWYDADATLLREDGAYAAMAATVDDDPGTVRTLLDLGGAQTRIYQAKMGMTKEWAAQLVALGVPGALPLAYDRVSGAPTATLGGLAAQAPGTAWETFHFALNNTVVHDNRIPPYAMSRDTALTRNAAPTPATQYGNPAPGGVYRHWDELALTPPPGAVGATVRLYYQPTSWEYVQFLELANDESNAFLGEEGERLRQAWQGTGMAAPYEMAKTTWGASPELFLDGFERGDACAWQGGVGAATACTP